MSLTRASPRASLSDYNTVQASTSKIGARLSNCTSISEEQLPLVKPQIKNSLNAAKVVQEASLSQDSTADDTTL